MKIKPLKIDDKQKAQRRRRRWRNTGIVFGAIALHIALGQFIMEYTNYGKFPDLYDTIRFRNSYKVENIQHMIYGETTVTVFHKTPTGLSIASYYYEGSLWEPVSFKTESIKMDIGTISVGKARKGVC